MKVNTKKAILATILLVIITLISGVFVISKGIDSEITRSCNSVKSVAVNEEKINYIRRKLISAVSQDGFFDKVGVAKYIDSYTNSKLFEGLGIDWSYVGLAGEAPRIFFGSSKKESNSFDYANIRSGRNSILISLGSILDENFIPNPGADMRKEKISEAVYLYCSS